MVNWITILWWLVGIGMPLLTATFTYMIIFWWRLRQAYNKDLDLFIDKSGRYSLVISDSSSKLKTDFKKGTYLRKENCSLQNKKGKVLYVYSEGHPNPMKLEYNSAKWLDADSTRAIFNNDMIQKMISQKNKIQDQLFLLVVLCTVVNVFITAAVALKLFGVIK